MCFLGSCSLSLRFSFPSVLKPFGIKCSSAAFGCTRLARRSLGLLALLSAE
jgi:hypothetical protein